MGLTLVGEGLLSGSPGRGFNSKMSLFFERTWGGPAQMLTLFRRVLGLCAWLSARIQPFSLCKEAACWAIELKLCWPQSFLSGFKHGRLMGKFISPLSPPASVSSLRHCARSGDMGCLAQCLHGCVGGADPGEEGQAAALPSCS